MKVLEKGRAQRGWANECRCSGAGNGGGGCNALLLVDEADLTAYQRSDMYGDVHGRCVTFECSECGVKTDLHVDREVARAVWNRVMKRQSSA